MNRPCTLPLFLALAYGGAWPAGAADKAEKPSPEKGFVWLFNDRNLDGWHVMNKGRFSVKDRVLFLDRGAGWLRSDKEYKDFELRMDFRFLNKGDNSGIFFRAGKEGKNYPAKNYQVQTMDHPSLGSIYVAGLARPTEKKNTELLKKTMKPAGQWQSYAITVKGPRVVVKFNGEVITVADGLADQAGYIGIQGEGGQLEFKNIRIKDVTAGKSD
jgi:hypothetical protein